MRLTITVLTSLSLFLLSSTTSQARLEDAPWPMFHHDIHHTGDVRHPGLIEGASGHLGGDTVDIVYIGSMDGHLYATDSEGRLKWRFKAGGGIESCPAIAMDGTIYVGADDNKLYAISPEGKLKWSFNTDWPIHNSPTVGRDGTIYVGGGSLLFAVTPEGELKWTFRTEDSVYSSPSIGADGTIYVGSDDYRLYAISPNGELLWRFTAGDWVRSSPVIDLDNIIYFGSSDGGLYALDSDGSLVWKFSTSWQISASPAIGGDGTLYVASLDGSLYAIRKGGDLRWRYKTDDLIESSPIIAEDGTVIVGSGDGKLYAINPDGTLKWAFKTADSIRSSPAIGTDGTIYVGSSDNTLYAINPDGTLKWTLPTRSWVVGSPTIFCPSSLVAQLEAREKTLEVRLYRLHLDYDLYEDGELVASNIVEVNPELLSEDFRKAVIQKIENVLRDMIKQQGALSEAELPPSEHEKLENKLVMGFHEMESSTQLVHRTYSELAKVAPSLDGLGSKVNRAWLMRWLSNSDEYDGTWGLTRRRMPRFNLSKEEVLDLEAFLLASNKKPLKEPAGEGDPEKGRVLFHVSRCAVCHSVKGKGGTLASDLSHITAKVNKTWLYNWIKNPLKIHPKAKMPQFNFSEQQVLDIVAYIWEEFGEEKPGIPREFVEISAASGDIRERIARGERVFMKYGCADCHGKPKLWKAQSPTDAGTPGKYPF